MASTKQLVDLDFSAVAKAIGLIDPSAAQDAATKKYVDDRVNGLSYKTGVRVATTVARTLATDFEVGDTIDGIILALNDRVLIKDQTAGAENGVYISNSSGAPTRAQDFDSSSEAVPGASVWVAEGSVNGDSQWTLTTDAPVTLGTTALVFTQTSGTGQITAGAGLTKTGNVLDVGAGTGISVASDTVGLDLSLASRWKVFTIGDGSAVSIAVTHNLNNQWVIGQVHQAATPFAVVPGVAIENTDANTTTVKFNVAPTASQYRLTVVG